MSATSSGTDIKEFSLGNSEALLLEQRTAIDAIDEELVKLLNERAKAALAVASIKIQHGLPIFLEGREDRVLERVMQLGQGPLRDLQIVRLFSEIMGESKQLQRELVDKSKRRSGDE